MPMASTIQPYANDKNRPFNAANMNGLGAGDELLLQVEHREIEKNKLLAASAGVPKNAMGPMTLGALGGSFFG